jgi:hypothetical protein
MRAAHLAIWLILGAILGAAPLTSGAQIVVDQGGPMANTYLGLNIGVSKYRFTNPTGPTRDGFCAAGAFECKNNPIGGKLTAGYMFMPYFGLEGEAFSMGDGHAKTDLGGGSTLQQKVAISGFGLSMVGALPLGPVSLNGRLGWAATTLTRKDDVDGVNFYRNSKSRGEPLFGAGIGFQVWRGMFLRLDWDRSRAESSLGEKFEADLYSAGIGWRF